MAATTRPDRLLVNEAHWDVLIAFCEALAFAPASAGRRALDRNSERANLEVAVACLPFIPECAV